MQKCSKQKIDFQPVEEIEKPKYRAKELTEVTNALKKE